LLNSGLLHKTLMLSSLNYIVARVSEWLKHTSNFWGRGANSMLSWLYITYSKHSPGICIQRKSEIFGSQWTSLYSDGKGYYRISNI